VHGTGDGKGVFAAHGGKSDCDSEHHISNLSRCGAVSQHVAGVSPGVSPTSASHSPASRRTTAAAAELVPSYST
jgi:hypothetical protein